MDGGRKAFPGMRTSAPARSAAFLTITLALLVPAGPALAHTSLSDSSPRDGERVGRAPAAVTLRFGEPVQSAFARVVVTSSDGNLVSQGRPDVVGRTVTTRLRNLPAVGRYSVAYRVVSADGHPVAGSVAFTYAPPGGGGAAPGPRQAPAATSTSRLVSEHGVHLAGALVVLAAALLVLVWERRSAR